ncbi:MAG TPA: TetR/AcrR family transcriptional regulator [Polyangia bacterium]
MSATGLRESKKRDKEARIGAAAKELIRRHGFAATTTAAVAERAGIAAGTLFRYVKTKEELLDLVFAGEIAAVVEEAFATLPKRGDIVKRLGHLFGRLLDYYQRDIVMARVLVAEALLPRAGARSLPLTVDFLQRVAALIGAEQTAGRLADDVNAVALAMDCFSLYVGGVLTVVNQMGRSSDARATLERALTIHFRGLRPPAQRSRR